MSNATVNGALALGYFKYKKTFAEDKFRILQDYLTCRLRVSTYFLLTCAKCMRLLPISMHIMCVFKIVLEGQA